MRLTGESNCFYLTREHQAYFPKFIVFLVMIIFFEGFVLFSTFRNAPLGVCYVGASDKP